METPQKTRVTYVDSAGKYHIISILENQVKFYNRWREIKIEIESDKWKGDNLIKAQNCMDKLVKKFTYQIQKDEYINCECGCEIMRCQMARHRETAKHNKIMELISETRMKTEPVEIADTDILCECGQVVSKANYKRHTEGSRHQKSMEKKKF